ncbi:MAG: sulfotransferase domain-containing protein [Pseudomonadales bacterium]
MALSGVKTKVDNRSNFSIKTDALQRLLMVNTLSKVLPLYIVTEYPKSGGSWLSQILAEYLDVPFPRNQRPKITSSLMHGHMSYSPFMSNVFCLHRDGRDIIASQYYHSLFQNDKNSPNQVERCRSDLNFLDYDDVQNNLGQFIEYVYQRDMASKSPFRCSWPEFESGWSGKDCVHLRYEDLVSRGVDVLVPAIEKVTGSPVDIDKLSEIYEKFSFQNQSKRKPGEENRSSFLRKGQPGDWKEKFNFESANVFDQYAGEKLIALGYEPDRAWIDNLK